MEQESEIQKLSTVLKNMPDDWLNLTTHRLDIYNESLAKTQFLKSFKELIEKNNLQTSALKKLPTAFDYIRLGHPLSCILEWYVSGLNNLPAENVISFASKTAPILAILRKNLFEKKDTRILYEKSPPDFLSCDVLKKIYGYSFTLQEIDETNSITSFEGTTV